MFGNMLIGIWKQTAFVRPVNQRELECQGKLVIEQIKFVCECANQGQNIKYYCPFIFMILYNILIGLPFWPICLAVGVKSSKGSWFFALTRFEPAFVHIQWLNVTHFTAWLLSNYHLFFLQFNKSLQNVCVSSWILVISLQKLHPILILIFFVQILMYLYSFLCIIEMPSLLQNYLDQIYVECDTISRHLFVVFETLAMKAKEMSLTPKVIAKLWSIVVSCWVKITFHTQTIPFCSDEFQVSSWILFFFHKVTESFKWQ